MQDARPISGGGRVRRVGAGGGTDRIHCERGRSAARGGTGKLSRPRGAPARRVIGAPLGATWLAHMNNGFTTTITDGIAELVINRPPVNALDDAGWHALADEIERLGSDPSARVIVLRAEGRGFCAGVDIKELDAHPERIVSVNEIGR